MASGTLRSGKARHTASGGRDGAGSGFTLNFYSRVFRCARFSSVFLYSSCGGECAVYFDKVAHRTSSRVRL